MIYHVTTATEWRCAEGDGLYAPEAFAHEGFIHACYSSQIEGVLQRYFTGLSDLLLLHIEESKLSSEVKEELSTGKEMFPHIYGKINKNAIVKIQRIKP